MGPPDTADTLGCHPTEASLRSSPAGSLHSAASTSRASPTVSLPTISSSNSRTHAPAVSSSPSRQSRSAEMSAEIPPEMMPQVNRWGMLAAATSELDDATVPCLAYGTPRSVLSSEDFAPPPPYWCVPAKKQKQTPARPSV